MLRQLALNPGALAQSLISGGFGGTFGNPQRSWLEGAWRDYYNRGRDPNAFRDSLAQRIHNSQARLKDSFSPGASAIGDQFLAWDQGEPSGPVTVFPRSQDVRWRGHVLAVGLHLVYLAPGGYVLRYLWTDHNSTVQSPDLAIFVAAVVIYGDHVLGADSVQGVQIWQLRRGERHVWTRIDAEVGIPALSGRISWLDQTVRRGENTPA
jgi:hypothetical protein